MKKTVFSWGPLVVLLGLAACNSGSNSSSSQTTTQAPETAKDSSGVTAGWRIGVQLWTFHEFPFVTAIEKADSAGVKYIEAFPGQKMGGDFGKNAVFGYDLSPADRAKVKQLLQAKGITMVAMGVVSPDTPDQWKKTFDLAKDMGLEYITAEPKDDQWNLVDSLAGAYGIKVAIHDHPRPSHYWSPDSVLAAVKGHPNLGSCADVGHWSRSGLDVVDCLKKLEGHIIGVHFKDVKEFNKTDAEDVITGTGVNKFPEIFAELKRQGFHGLFSIERENNWQHNVPDVIAEVKFFHDQVAQLK
ncbi:MAG TPA: sugar phosphate isomerase/epimerase family protein [Chitinophagaceae bacterium]|nr:sugar phosphate isomerase/epimerase family protein [Chitinophagaceae bacterium]